MHIEKVEIENFKCIEKLEFKPKKINLIVGRNKTGKTSLLEALDSVCNHKKTVEKHMKEPSHLINVEGETAKIKCVINGSEVTVRMKRPEKETVLTEFKKEFIEALESYCWYLRIKFSPDEKINSILDNALDETLIPLLKEESVTVSVNGKTHTYFAFADRIVRQIEGPIIEVYEIVHKRNRIKNHGRRRFIFFDMLIYFLRHPASRKTFSDEPERIMFLEDLDIPKKRETRRENAVKIKEMEDFIKSEKLLDGMEKFGWDCIILKENGKRTSMPFDLTGKRLQDHGRIFMADCFD